MLTPRRFRQSAPGDFLGDNYVDNRNRLLYPEMTARLRSYSSSSSRQIWIEGSVSGFILDLDSSIPDYVFSLIDVYRQGKGRLDQLTAGMPRSKATEPSSKPVELTAANNPYVSLPTSNVVMSLVFSSGQIRIHNKVTPRLSRTSSSFTNASRRRLEDGDPLADTFNLPVVTVWGEYRATPASNKLGSEVEPSILMFRSTVHSSQNSLKPTLLPFVTDVVSHVETRMRRSSQMIPSSPSIKMHDLSIVSEKLSTTQSGSSMQISFSLRIDQSKLEFTCQPDVNVVAGLHWDSGGFVLNVLPSARRVTFTGTVDGLTVSLKHGFLSEDSVRLNARDLSFLVTFAKESQALGSQAGSISAVLDTEFSGSLRMSRFQDVLCFKAVWLDRIPVFAAQNVQTKTVVKPAIETLPHGVQPKQDIATAILIRARRITFDADLGQQISTVVLDLTNTLVRTTLTGALHEVSLFVEDLSILAKGSLSGRVAVPRCIFQTIRRIPTDGAAVEKGGKMLELCMTSGALSIILVSDHQKLLHYLYVLCKSPLSKTDLGIPAPNHSRFLCSTTGPKNTRKGAKISIHYPFLSSSTAPQSWLQLQCLRFPSS